MIAAILLHIQLSNTGADPGFQVRGGTLKKIAPSGGRRENIWGILCQNHDFTPKNHISFPILGGRAPPGSAPATVGTMYA